MAGGQAESSDWNVGLPAFTSLSTSRHNFAKSSRRTPELLCSFLFLFLPIHATYNCAPPWPSRLQVRPRASSHSPQAARAQVNKGTY